MSTFKDLKEEEKTKIIDDFDEYINSSLTRDEFPTVFLNSHKIERDYPVFYKNFSKWLTSIPLEDPIGEDMIGYIIAASPRTLYDYFDSKDTVIFIIKQKEGWTYNFIGEDKSQFYKNRVTAEYNAFMEIIEKFNKI